MDKWGAFRGFSTESVVLSTESVDNWMGVHGQQELIEGWHTHRQMRFT